MKAETVLHLPPKTKVRCTEAMCGEAVTDNSMICADLAWALETGEATCARCVEINRSEEDQRPSRPTRPTVSGSDDIASVVTPPTGWPLAERDWHTRARIRIVREITVNSTAFCAPRTYRVGEELTMVQDGLAGGQVDRGTWRMSIDDRALP